MAFTHNLLHVRYKTDRSPWLSTGKLSAEATAPPCRRPSGLGNMQGHPLCKLTHTAQVQAWCRTHATACALVVTPCVLCVMQEVLLKPHLVKRTKRMRGVSTHPPLKDVACGSYASYAVDEEGHVWAWGLNQYGQLGLPDLVTPHFLPLLPCLHILLFKGIQKRKGWWLLSSVVAACPLYSSSACCTAHATTDSKQPMCCWMHVYVPGVSAKPNTSGDLNRPLSCKAQSLGWTSWVQTSPTFCYRHTSLSTVCVPSCADHK